jgi:hypothetical protein
LNNNDPAANQPAEISPDSVRAHLGRILASEQFASSGRLSRFLKFTVEEVLNGRADQLKEYHIGTAVFDRDTSYDPRTDPIVRVEAGRLRNRLAAFYDADGQNDTLRIELRRGSYAPAFQLRPTPPESQAEQPSPAATRGGRRKGIAGAIAAALGLAAVVCAAWAVAANRRAGELERQLAQGRLASPAPPIQAIWGPFLERGSKNTVVFGSPLFFETERYRMYVRLYGVNDPATFAGDPEYRKMAERLGDLSGPRFDYASMGDAIAIHRLTAFFARYGREINAVPAHEASWEMISNGNIIFLGYPRMNPLLRRLPVPLDFQFGPPDTHVYNLNPKPREEKIYTTPSHDDAVTYAVIADVPGLRPDRHVMTLIAHQGAGLGAAVDYLTDARTAQLLADRLGLSPSGPRKRYQLLMRVVADKGRPVTAEYVTHHDASP